MAAHALAGSNEYKAAQEWSSYFLENMNSEEELQAIAEVSKKSDCRRNWKNYSAYNALSQRTADKIDEITGKYNLKLLSEPETIEGYDEIISKVGINDFLAG